LGAVSADTDFLRRVYAALNARDREAIAALTAPDIVFTTTVETHRGREGLLAWVEDGDETFDDFTVELQDAVELGGHVVASVRQRGRGRASGAEVDHSFTHVWTVRDGIARSLRSFTDREDAVRYATAEPANPG
jgi:uncharacterized protein